MTRVNAAAVGLVLAAGTLLAATRMHRGGVYLERSFLTPLSHIPVGRDLSEAEQERYGKLIWHHAEELRYFARTDDALAVRAVVRLMGRGSVPGGCSCFNDEFDECVFADGTTPEFWSELDSLPREAQLNVLRRGDANRYTEATAPRPWEEDRDEFLLRREGLRRAYEAAVMADSTPGSDGQ